MSITDKALSSVRVLEVAEMVAGPYCAKLLADLGAQVTKVERPGTGDPSRSAGPFPHDVPHPERSGLFLYLNTNKHSITLNLEDPRGREILLELAKGVDILVEDRPPELAEGLGLNYEDLARVNPRLVMVSITPFGLTGPHSSYKAYHLNTYQSGGDGYCTPGGWSDLSKPPLQVGNFTGDYIAGTTAAIAALIAAYSCRLHGRGQLVDISKQESLLALNRVELPRYMNEGVMINRVTRGYAYAGIMPCQDGHIQFCIHEEKQWQGVVELMGKPAWTQEEKYRDIPGRTKHGEEVNRLLNQWLKEHSREEIFHGGQARGGAVAPYYSPGEVVHSPQMKARNFFVPIAHPEAGTLLYPSAPYKLSKTPWSVSRPAPLLGQHNQEVYCERLGYPGEELARLRRLGVI